MEIKYNKVIDLTTTLSLYVNKAIVLEVLDELDGNFTEINLEWNKILDEEVNYFIKNDLKLIFENFVNHSYIQGFIVKNEINDFKEFINQLEKEDPENYVNEVLNILELDSKDQKITQETIMDSSYLLRIDIIENFEKQAELIHEFIKNPRAILNKIIEVYNEIYPLFENKILEKYKKEIEKIDDYSYEDNKNHITKLIGKYDYKIEEFNKVFINFVSTTGDSFNNELNYLVISDRLDDVIEKKFEQKEYLDFIKAISDQKRVKIIKLLSQGKYCNSDLAKKLELTPATMSYHLNKLMQLNILDIEKGDYNKLFYTLDKEKLKKKFDKSFEHITA